MKKRVLLLLLCVVTALSLAACSSEAQKDNKEPDVTPSQADQSEAVESEAPSPGITDAPEVTDAPEITDTPVEPTDAPSQSQAMPLDSVCLMIKNIMGDGYSGCDVTHNDDNMIIVNIWVDGLAMELLLGGDDTKASWGTVRDNMISLSNSISDLVDATGNENVYTLLSVLNDMNHENALLSITEGVVIYDIMDE